MKLLKRCIAALALSSITFTAPGPMWAGGVQVSANLKRETYLEDIDAQKDAMRRPNVLFLIEATAAMASTPRGVIPQVWRDDRWDDSYWESGDWTQTKRKLGITIYDVNRMMKDFTFGMGALPAAWRGLDIRPERNLYGRDLDDRNNFKRGMNLEMEIELNKDNYYFPFLEEDNALTGLYSGQTIPLEVGFKNAPELWPDRVTYGKFRPLTDVCSVSHPKEDWVSGTKLKIGYTSSIPEINQSTGAVKWTDNVNWYNPSKKKLEAARMRFEGDEQVAYYDYRGLSSAKKPYPYALVFKDPKYWATGWTEGRAPDDDDLVPNDSRMYQTKLVLWNLLQDKELFKNIRFGMATTFLSPANVEIGTYAHTHSGYAHPRQDINGIFKVYPFASNLKTKSYFDINGNAYPSSEQEKDFIDSHSGSYEAQQVPPGYRRVRYENGAMYGPTTGEIEAFFTIHGQYYPIWHNATVHANYATKNADGSEPAGWTKDRNDGELSDRPMYKLMNRASLHLPIMEPDHKWEKGGKTITHIDKFRMWINGIADIKSAGTSRTESASDKSTNRKALVEPARNSQFHYYNDPEIGVAGVFALPQAIFPDPTPRHPYTGQELNLSREYYLSRGWVWYSMKDFNINYRADFRRHSDEIQSTGIPRARYNAGSGEAAGSVLDFFSPPINYNIDKSMSKPTENEPYANPTRDLQIYNSNTKADDIKRAGIDITQLDDVSFPIHSRCEDNWLIVIASGTEPKVADGTVYSYSGWEAVKNLYDSTDAVRSRDVALPTGPRKAPYRKVTMMDKDSAGRVVLREIDPDNPIRTLVIGIVASEDDPEVKNNALVLAEVRRMRLNLIRMAVAGQGGDASKINYGNMYDAPHQPFFADDVSSLKTAIRNALTSVTSVHKPVQASGSVVEIKDAGDGGREFISASYRIVSNNQWEGTLTGYRAEITKNEITGVTPSDSWELGRKLLNKRDTGGGLDVSIWDPSAKKFSSLSQSEAASKNIFGLDGRLTVLQKSGRLSFNEAMYQWVKGYDYSYMKDISYPRNNLLADFSLHSIAVVGKPRTAADSLPGYMEWAEDEMSKDKRKTLYLQTNDGLMHMVDPATGNPRKILLLPPMLVPTRLASLKTNPAGDKLSWLEVTAADGKDGAMRSHPAFTMDGPLQKKDFRGIAPGDAWGTYLLGSLGRGGSGLYMMDVREYDDPKFMWYYEKYGENLISMPPGASAPAISAGGGTEAAGYMKLGYSSPAPAAGVVMTPGSDADGNPNMQNVIIMAGGAQSSADLAQNGREGAVLLVIDPKDGSILRAFDGNSVENGTRVGSGVTGPAPYMGMMVSEPALLRSESGEQYARYTVGRAYAADNRGNIFALMMEGADSPGSVSRLYPRQWSIKTAATLQPSLGAAGSSSNSYAVPYGVVAVKYDDSYWIAGGTSNAVTKKESSDDTGEIQNEKQMIFSFKTSDGQTAPLARNDLQELAKSSQTGDPVMDANGRGWFITLDTVKGFEETVMAKPQIAGDTLYVATFTRTKIDLIGAGDICSGTGKSESGYSRIYAVSVKNGAADFWPPLNNKKMKYLQIEDVKITGLTKVQNRGGVTLWASFEDLSGGSLSGIDSSKARYLEGMNVVEMDTPSGGAKTLIPPGESVIYYWNLK